MITTNATRSFWMSKEAVVSMWGSETKNSTLSIQQSGDDIYHQLHIIAFMAQN